jgi:CDP-diglyceride synthetase
VLKVALGAGLAVVGIGALSLGPVAFTVLVLALALVVLIDMSVLSAGAGARPVLPVALIPGLVLPAMVAADVTGSSAAGWDRIPGAFAVAFLLGFLLVLVFGRRGGAVVGLGATAVISLVIGLGASALLLLRGLPDGYRWVLAMLLLTLAADIAGPLARQATARRAWDAGEESMELDVTATPLHGVLPALVAVALVGVAVALLLSPPLTPLMTAMLALIAVVAALAGAYLQRALAAEAAVDPDDPELRVGQGALLAAVDALVLSAPAAYVLARSVAL